MVGMLSGREGMEGEKEKLDFSEREVVLRASLDELDDERCVWTPLRFIVSGPRQPRVGESVFLIDRRGRACPGKVVELNGWMARVRPDFGNAVP
jgi:hypothetical protein